MARWTTGRPLKYHNKEDRDAAIRASKRAYYHRNKESERNAALRRYYKKRTPPKHNPKPFEPRKTVGTVKSLGITSPITRESDLVAIQSTLWGLLGVQVGIDERPVYEARAREVLDKVEALGWNTYRDAWRARLEEVELVLTQAMAILKEANRREISSFGAAERLCRAADKMACCEAEIGALMGQGLVVYKEALVNLKLIWQTAG